MSNLNNFKYNARVKNTNSKVGKRNFTFIEKEKHMTKHHVPPRTPDVETRIIKKDERHHRAYHMTVGNPASFQECCLSLWKNWWAKNPDDPMPTIRGHQKF